MHWKPILIELVPLALLGLAWFAMKNLDKSPEKSGWLARRIQRIKWNDWLLTLMLAVLLALIITKSVL